MSFETLASIVGLSSIISVCINIIFGFVEKKKMLKFEISTHEKEHGYRSTLVFMLVILDKRNIRHIYLEERHRIYQGFIG